MNFVFISPNFPEAYRWFCVRLKENGVNVLGVGDAPYDFLHPDLKRALTEYYRVDSLEDYDQALRALGYFTGRYGKIDWVESNNEYWLELDARLRTDFNITTGPKAHEIGKYKSKLAMKEYYRKAGIPCARCAPVTDLEAGLAFARETGYPVVAKPDNGVGAVATWKLENEEDLRRFFQAPPETPYLMEEYVSGSVTTYDGICDSRGEVLFAASHVTRNSIMDMVNKHVPTYYYVDKEVPPDVEAAGKATQPVFPPGVLPPHRRQAGAGGRGGHRGPGGQHAPRRGLHPGYAGFQPERGRVPALGGHGGLRRAAPHLHRPPPLLRLRRDDISLGQLEARCGDRARLFTRMPDALAGTMGNQVAIACFDTMEEVELFVRAAFRLRDP